MLTKKHFIKAAKAVNAVVNTNTLYARGQAEDIAAVLIDVFKEDNARFDEDRFRKACGLAS